MFECVCVCRVSYMVLSLAGGRTPQSLVLTWREYIVPNSLQSVLKDSVLLGVWGWGGGAELLTTIYVHYTIFLIMLFNIK